jgi:hypothetical protein
LCPIPALFTLSFHLRGFEENSLNRIKDIIKEHPGDSPVILDVAVPGKGEYAIETELSVKYGQKFFADVEELLGQDSWELKSV